MYIQGAYRTLKVEKHFQSSVSTLNVHLLTYLLIVQRFIIRRHNYYYYIIIIIIIVIM